MTVIVICLLKKPSRKRNDGLRWVFFKILSLKNTLKVKKNDFFLKQMAQPLTQKEQLGISLLNETLLEQLRVKTMQPGRIDVV